MNKIDKKWQLKIICLLLAIVLWFVIINEQNPLSEGSYTVPITVENLDSQYITSNVPKTVYVRLSGPRIYASRVADEPWLNGAAPDPQPETVSQGMALYLRAMVLLAACLLAASLI